VEFTFSTLILELINFLVLVWILKRFLYRPVLDIVARRRARIDEMMANAKRVEKEAQLLKERYEKRRGEWESEQAEARDTLAHELNDERARQLAVLRRDLEEEVEKNRAAEARRLTDLRDTLEKQGLALGARFASRLLAGTAAADLQGKLLDLFLADLDASPRDRIVGFLGKPELPLDAVDVASAFELTGMQQQALRERAKTLCGADVPVRFSVDPSLLAGIRLATGGCVLGLNLKDELDGFARLSDVGA